MKKQLSCIYYLHQTQSLISVLYISLYASCINIWEKILRRRMAMVKRVFREKYTLQATINLQFEYMKTNLLNLHRLICIMSPKLGQCMKGWQTIGDIWNVVLLTLNKNYLDWENTRWAGVGKCNGSKQRISEDNTKENTGIAWTHVITRGWILKKKTILLHIEKQDI